MTDETNIEDLFAGDDEKPKATKPPKEAAGRTKRKPRAAAKPKAAEPPAEGEPDTRIDNAVNIRRLDWECVCGNTNTLDLQRCGKCNAHRYTTD